MPRPKSDEKRSAIIAAATRVVSAEGLGASTASIAKEAGIANGSLFTYFETKTDLLNQLYLELKIEMAAAAMRGLAEGGDLHDQFFQIWRNWTSWAVSHSEKRQALAQLSVCDELTSETRLAGHRTMAAIAELLERIRGNGPMNETPMAFLMTLMNSVAESTMDFMRQDPKRAKEHCRTGFEAVWRMVA
jgi:AcrR family transcriptional regulator